MAVDTSPPCEACSGSGIAAGSKRAQVPFTCPICAGAGRIRRTESFFTVENTCPFCKAKGRVVDTPCMACAGSGRGGGNTVSDVFDQAFGKHVTTTNTRFDLQIDLADAFNGMVADVVSAGRPLKVNVPAGIEDGYRIRVAGEGEGSPRGDFYIHVAVQPHPLFTRKGNDLHYRATIPLDTAIYGRHFEFVRLDGRTVSVKAPEGVQSGTVLRLRGQGMPILNSQQRGDLHVTVFVETPRARTAKSEPVIVVSYRRSDTKLIVGRIVERLITRFGKTSVFVDIDNMPIGRDFREHIRATVRDADVVLALVGHDWVGRQAGGNARILDEGDWVRIEVEMALRQGIPVIPVLVDQALMPQADLLPASLREFTFRHAVDLDPGRDFNAHMDRLIRNVAEILGRTVPDAEKERPRSAKKGLGWLFRT